MTDQAERKALRGAATEVHRESRWQEEMRGRRGMTQVNSVERPLMVERILRNRAERLTGGAE